MKRSCYNNTDANKVQYIVSIQPHKAPSNNNFLGLLIDGAGVMSAGLHKFGEYVSGRYDRNTGTHIEVPVIAAGLPMMILSDTPAMLSVFPYADASNRWSVVFSNEANMSTLSFILATPKRVIPSTSP